MKAHDMGDFNAKHNRVVWLDIPVADLDRACTFYSAVLGCEVFIEEHEGTRFAVLDHEDGNGGTLIVSPGQIGDRGPLAYFNADGRIRHALQQVEVHGGAIDLPLQAIGPHGYRAIVTDSEGNRIALHSNADA
jgi:predicted enzyme related to lactoylglutathione lyase